MSSFRQSVGILNFYHPKYLILIFYSSKVFDQEFLSSLFFLKNNKFILKHIAWTYDRWPIVHVITKSYLRDIFKLLPYR